MSDDHLALDLVDSKPAWMRAFLRPAMDNPDVHSPSISFGALLVVVREA